MVAFSQRYVDGGYLEHAPDWHAGDAEWKAGKVLEMVERHGLAPRSICDIGCGSGDVLAQLHERMGAGVRFEGFDISPQAIALARAKRAPNLDFRELELSRPSSEVFDLVLSLDVFEHVPDYLSFLEQVKARGRHFIFHVPLDINAFSVLRKSDYLMVMRKEYGHLHYFTLETALATLADTGYTVLDHFYTWDHETASLSSPELLARPWRWGVRAADRALFALSPRLAASLRPHFNTLVLARA
jgi:SAM-dependent methyltransferase